ncbi:MAG TPA: low specificity L-threonine aldolase [Alphaproteobacteria bacterium]|nr:low specificity L-threonine aldolase [Alphaproteobacteria bacterium]
MNFASDNWAGALPGVMEAVTRRNSGFAPAYGGDEATASVAGMFREIFETNLEVHFVATGTAANSLAMAALARPGGLVFCSSDAHIHTDEYGATESLTGMKLVPVAGRAGKIDAEGLTAALAQYPHGGRSGPAVALTLTNATECGTVYRPDDIARLAEIAKIREMAVHVDGARFANAVAATGASPAELTWKVGVDVMSFGGTKNGCLGAEAIVVFTHGLLPHLPVIRQRAGQVMSKARFVAAQFEGYFADGAWLGAARHANEMARRLAEGIRARTSTTNGARLAWDSEANEVFAILPRTTIQRLRQEGAVFHEWPAQGLGPSEDCVRLVTSFATSEAEIYRFVSLI